MPNPAPRPRLTQKQIRFVREYAIHGNGAEAVRRSGYSQSSNGVVYQQAKENLRKPTVKSALKQEIARMGLNITPERVQRRLDEISHASQAAGQFGPATRCEELLGRSIGMFIDQSIQLSGALNDSHISALLEVARRRREEPIDLADDRKAEDEDE